MKRERRTDGAKPTNRTANATTDMAQLATTTDVSYNVEIRSINVEWDAMFRARDLSRMGANNLVAQWMQKFAGVQHGAKMYAQTLTETARDSEAKTHHVEFDWMGEPYKIVVRAMCVGE